MNTDKKGEEILPTTLQKQHPTLDKKQSNGKSILDSNYQTNSNQTTAQKPIAKSIIGPNHSLLQASKYTK